MSTPNPISEYGFAPVPANPSTLFTTTSNPPPPFIPVSSTPIPDTPLARRIQEYARIHLPQPTYHHSLRVYHYGLAIKRHAFPSSAEAEEWAFSDETYFLTCMLHDIGTTAENLRATRLSFEFFGGYLALDVLRNDKDNKAGEGEGGAVAPQAQAESVAEAIIRHQDLRDVGMITAVGQLVQLATIFDNVGGHAHLVHEDTVKDVIEHYPRLKWSSCFASTVGEEVALKPWAHTTALGDFRGKILGNPYNRYE
ncbi:putative urea hydro-lyase/cyanamide hydratase [Aspergillus lucknowensis]|uniref:HD domain-containing protein n=1 Tax=Aspergillus lucknowensis TaxID=176173 RepID=A0ABR4LFQ0_9EURO